MQSKIQHKKNVFVWFQNYHFGDNDILNTHEPNMQHTPRTNTEAILIVFIYFFCRNFESENKESEKRTLLLLFFYCFVSFDFLLFERKSFVFAALTSK